MAELETFIVQAAVWLFGESAPCEGHSAEYVLEHTFPLGPWFPIIALAASAALIGYFYRRERSRSSLRARAGLAMLRLSLVGLVVLMMYGWMLRAYCTDLPDLIVVIDDSASMLEEDQYDDPEMDERVDYYRVRATLSGEQRLTIAKAVLLANDEKLLRELDRRYNLEVYRLASTVRPVSGDLPDIRDAIGAMDSDPLESEHARSRLGDGLRQILDAQRGGPTAAVVVLTDGVTTDGKTIAQTAELARRRAVPLYLVGIGSDQPPQDVRLTDLLADEVVFVGDQIHFDFSVSATGYKGRKAEVRLRRKGESRVLAKQNVTLQGDGELQSLRLSHRTEEAGEFEYVVEIDQLEGEARSDNNSQSTLVSVRDETIKALMVFAYPTHEYRFLKSLLGRAVKGNSAAANKAVDLSVVLQHADPDYAELDENALRSFPVSREELFEYDVVIFGDVEPAFLTHSVMENLAAFVEERGGGLVVIGGPRFTPMAYDDTPLARLLPVDVSTVRAPSPDEPLVDSFRPQPTRLGMTSPQLQLAETPLASLQVWRQLNGLYWMLEAPDVKPGARVLLEHPTRTGPSGANLPVVAMQYAGAGKVIFHAVDDTRLWRYRAGDIYFARYWLQTLRFLSRATLLGRSRQAELTTDREEYRQGDTVRLRVRFLDERLAPPQNESVSVMLEQEQGKRRRLSLNRGPTRGIFEASLSGLTEGRYRAWMVEPMLEGKPPSRQFSVSAPQGEHSRLEMDSADLALAAQRTSGEFYTVKSVDEMLEDLPRGRQVRIKALPASPIWNSWKFALLFVVLIVSEWLLRKRAGMV